MKIFKNNQKQNIFYEVNGYIKKILYVLMLILFFIPNCAYANSSWHWISTTRPYDVLPFVVVLTLAIETISLFKFSHIENKLKTFLVVLVGNILSFIAPYAFEAYVAINGGMYTFIETLEQTPFYNIGFIYLIVTILVEFPVVYNILKKESLNRKTLIVTIICSNILTTLFTYFTERIFCKGVW